MATTRRSATARLGTVSGYISGIAWFAVGIDSILRPIQDNRRDALWFICFATFFVSYWCLGHIQKSAHSAFERFTFFLLMLASAVVAAGQLGNVFDVKWLQILGFPVGAMVWLLAMLFYGIATWRLKIVPRYAAMALILWEPGSIVTGLALSPVAPLFERGAYSAGLEKGVATLVLALGLRAYARDEDHSPRLV